MMGGGSAATIEDTGVDPVESVGKLNHIFAIFDELQDILKEVLDDWDPPRVVVLGNQSEGTTAIPFP